MEFYHKWTILLLIFFLQSIQVSAQLKYYDIEEIPAKELIKSISKDEMGFIWLATDQGTMRFDGSETELYYKNIPIAYTKGFLKRKNGQFLLLHDLGILEIISDEDTVYFQNPTIHGHLIDESFNYPKSIYEDANQNVWIGEYNSIVKISKAGIERYSLGTDFQSISYHRSFAFDEDAFQNLWVAPYKGPLLKYDKALNEFIPVQLENELTDVCFLEVHKGDYLLMGGAEGLLRIKVDSDRNILGEQFIDEIKNLSAAIAIKDKEVYIGSWFDGIHSIAFNGNAHQIKEVPVNFSDIIDFHYDSRQSELWVTGSENVGLFKPTIISGNNKVGNNRIESIALDNAGRIYYSIGQTILSYEHDEPVEKVLDSDTTYFDQILVEDNLLWVGDAFGSIFHYNLQDHSTSRLQENSNNPITHIFRDSKGNKWFSGINQWLTRIDSEQRYIKYENVTYSRVVKESSSGSIFCGGQGQDQLIYEYKVEMDSLIPVKLQFDFNVAPNIQAEDMVFDKKDNIWLATDQGVLFLQNDDGRYQKAELISVEGIDDQQSTRAIAIADDIIWFANSLGLIAYQDSSITLYTNENGLPSKIIKDRGITLNQDSSLLIATAKGLASVQVSDYGFEKTPKPIFKSLYINGQKYQVGNHANLSLPYNARLQAEFVSMSYPGRKINYQTKIIGIDDDWANASTSTNLSVLGFSEGNYTLAVRARDAGSLWSESLTMNFSVSSPWFRTWWAYLIFLATAALLIIVAIKIYNQHLIRQKKRLQKIIEARTQEINRQKNEIIEHKNKIIQQKQELIDKNKSVFESQQALSEADLKYLHLKEKQLQDQIEFKNKQITTHTLNIIQKNETLKDLRVKIDRIVKSPNGSLQSELRKTLKVIDESFKLDKDWEEFKLYFEQVYTGFYSKLKVNYSELTAQELRHCALIRLNLNIAECASILGISPESVKVSRTRLRKKLGLKQGQNLNDFIISI